LTLRNTIVANNTAINPATANCRIALNIVDYDEGGNLDSGTSCRFTNPASKSNANANLGPLQNNGGQTDTMALIPPSDAIDAGVPCLNSLRAPLTFDQRSFRPVDGDGNGTPRIRREAGPFSPTPNADAN
jgi:hypothetical protein